MKKFTSVLCLLLSAVLLFWNSVFADTTYKGYSMEVLRVAVTLNYEYGNAPDDASMLRVGATIRNRVLAARNTKSGKNVTFSDIIYQANQYTTYKVNGNPRWGDTTSNFSGEKLYRLGESINGPKYWERCLRVANQVVKSVDNPNWNDPSKGAVGYHHIATMKKNEEAIKAGKPPVNKGELWLPSQVETARDQAHRYYKYKPHGPGLGIAKHKNYNMDASKGDNSALEKGVKISNNQGSPAESGTDSDGSEEAANCGFEAMQKIYLLSDDPNVADLQNDKVEEACWYCKVVVVLTNAYLQGARNALSSSIALGKIILYWGFAIWLAYYLLQQVSSISPITPGKMLQEILLMGFKVALAWVCINTALNVISTYYLNPIVGLGVDYGNALFAKLG